MSEIMIQDIKAEIDEHEDIPMHIEKHKFRYDCLQNEKMDEKNVTDMDSMPLERSCGREDYQQAIVKLNDFLIEINSKHEHTECKEVHNEVICDSEILKMETEVPDDVKVEKEEHKVNYACLKIEEREDKENIFICARSSSKTDCGSENGKQLNAADYRKYDATEGIYDQELHTKVTCDSDIVKLEMDGPEAVERETGQHKLSYTCLEIGKIEDIESMFISDNSNEADFKLQYVDMAKFNIKGKHSLMGHCELKHGGTTEWYECQDCGFKTKKKHYLNKHFKLKHDDSTEWYKCHYCEFISKRKDHLKQHFKQKHDDSTEWYKCQHCEYKTKRKDHLEKHFILKHDDSAEWYKCQRCEFKTKWKYALTGHFRKKHDDTAECCRCEYCEFETKNKYRLNNSHFKLHHDDNAEWYKCRQCKFETKNKSQLKQHFRLKHDRSAEWYECQHCEFKTKSKHRLKYHFNLKHDESAEWYKCEYCEFETKNKYTLKQHFKLKHDNAE